MSLAAQRAQYTCRDYTPCPGEVRCVHYLDGGACDRPDYLMCVEWLRQNGQASAAELLTIRPKASTPPTPTTPPIATPSSTPPSVTPLPPANGSSPAPAPSGPVPDPPPLPPLPGGDFAALFSDEALRELAGTEVDLEFPGIGVVTFLDECTAEDRLELTWRDVRRLVAIAYLGFQGKAWLRGLRRRRPSAERSEHGGRDDGEY
jgi:hypothetical protein